MLKVILYSPNSSDLAVPFKRTGSIVVALMKKKSLTRSALRKGKEEQSPGLRLLDQTALRALEPHISDQAVAALYAETAGIICPFTLTIALAENAYANGVEFFFNAEVKKVYALRPGAPRFLVKTDHLCLETRYIVNAAGVHADNISRLAGAIPLPYAPAGEYCL